jgi:hypothetical protein
MILAAYLLSHLIIGIQNVRNMLHIVLLLRNEISNTDETPNHCLTSLVVRTAFEDLS